MEMMRWDHPPIPGERTYPLRGRRLLKWERCPLCGLDGPSYRVETPDHVPLGCERCLLVYRDGVVQL